MSRVTTRCTESSKTRLTCSRAPSLSPSAAVCGWRKLKIPSRILTCLTAIRSTATSSTSLARASRGGWKHCAKERNIPVGPGRGSAAGSLVSYSLGITDLDPLQHELLFERFLNPERISMPDIDIDFCMNRRGEVIDYITRKYGRENVAQIITFGTMAAKAAIKDVGRAMDIPYADVDRIAKMVPTQLNITLDQAIADSPQLNEAYAKDPQVR